MKWFDPISSRWIVTPDPPALDPVVKDCRALPISAEHARIWEAVVASATASSISSRNQEHQDD